MKEIKTINYNQKKLNYLVETYENGIVIDYSKGFELPVTKEIISYFSNVGGHSREIFEKFISKKELSKIYFSPIQLSEVAFYTILFFEFNNGHVEYILSNDSYFTNYLVNTCDKQKFEYIEILSFDLIKKKDCDIYKDIFYPENTQSTGIFKQDGSEVLFGESFTININNENKQIMEGFIDLSEAPVVKAHINMFENITPYGFCCDVSYELDNGLLVDNKTASFVDGFSKNIDIFSHKDVDEWFSIFTLNKIHTLALEINKRRDILSKTYADNQEYLISRLKEDVDSYMNQYERDISDYNKLFKNMYGINMIKSIFPKN